MEVKTIHQDKENINFTIKGASSTIVNTLRRSILEEVPTMAIEDVKIIKNNSAMYDEVLAHRLGLIPLTTDLKSYVLPNKCRCKGKGCAQCQLILTLKVNGPKIVYAEDLVSKDPKVKPVFPKMQIAYLTKKQSIEIEAKAVLGKGKDHVKFSPGIAFYRGYPQFEITDGKGKEEVKDICPVDIIELENKKIKIKDTHKCILCMACSDINPEGIKLKSSDKDFIFFIESFGQLEPKVILTQSIEVIDDKLEELKKELAKLK